MPSTYQYTRVAPNIHKAKNGKYIVIRSAGNFHQGTRQRSSKTCDTLQEAIITRDSPWMWAAPDSDSAQKVFTWSGPQKDAVRKLKIALMRAYVPARGKFRAMLSFPGANATLEKEALAESLIEHKNILAVQHCAKAHNYNGVDVVRAYAKSMVVPFVTFLGLFKNLPSMFSCGRIELDTTVLHSFTRRHEKALLPERAWFRNWDVYKQFDVLDLDFCGQFCETNLKALDQLMEMGLLARKGLLFVSHMGGRELGQARRMIGAQKNSSGTRLRIENIPLSYVKTASKHGYKLDVIKIVHYKDAGIKTQFGAPMYQYCFAFRRSAGAARAGHIIHTHSQLATLAHAITRTQVGYIDLSALNA
jgi:hypothetical protein